jgi:hypothetical protein
VQTIDLGLEIAGREVTADLGRDSGIPVAQDAQNGGVAEQHRRSLLIVNPLSAHPNTTVRNGVDHDLWTFVIFEINRDYDRRSIRENNSQQFLRYKLYARYCSSDALAEHVSITRLTDSELGLAVNDTWPRKHRQHITIEL